MRCSEVKEAEIQKIGTKVLSASLAKLLNLLTTSLTTHA